MASLDIILEGLDCPNCAQQISMQTSKLNGVTAASVDIVSQHMHVNMLDGTNGKTLVNQVEGIVKRLEPDVHVHVNGEAHDHEHDHDHEHTGSHAFHNEVIRLVAGGLIFLVVTILDFDPIVEFVLYILSYLIIGSNVLLSAGRAILRGDVFNEFFLMSIATLGAFALGEYAEGVGVMLFYLIGEMMQGRAVSQSRKSITALMKIRPDYANLKQGTDIIKVAPEKVAVGDTIIIRPGEKVPLDGRIIQGVSTADTSALTGESLPLELKPGDLALSGYINQQGLLTVEVARSFGESTVSKILELVQNAASRKAPTEAFITRFARIYTPLVVFTAAALAIIPPLLIAGHPFAEWVRRALVFLVISCPCALVISIPLGFFGGLGGASKQGILVKGGNYLEALNQVDTMVFDKTGTLTKGVFAVESINPRPGFTQEELLQFAAYAEAHSSHPIAQSILKAHAQPIALERISGYEEIAGHGVKAAMDRRNILAGKASFLNANGISVGEETSTGATIYVAVDGIYAGNISIADQLKTDAAQAIHKLKKLGIKQTVMLTGDQRAIGEKIGVQLNIDKVYAELLPGQKVEKLEQIMSGKKAKGKTAFVGDGVNDAPVLARADIGIAMGGLGSDAAIEAADVVIMNDEPSKIATAVKIARRTHAIVIQNIVLALGVKAVFLMLGALGMMTMWGAVFADTGVALLAVLNAMRALQVKGL